MPVKSLIIGEKVKISEHIKSSSFEFRISIESSLTIDITCFGLDAQKRLSDDRYMIFYNQLSAPDNSIKIIKSNDKETVFLVSPAALPTKIQNLVFTATIDGEGTMSQIKHGHVSIFSNSQELISFHIKGSDFKNERAIILNEIYYKDTWRLSAVAKGFDGGLSALLKHFGGVEIEAQEACPSSAHGLKYYFSLLKTSEKQTYTFIENGLKSMNSNIELGPVDNKSIGRIFNYVLLDNPSIFYLSKNYGISMCGSDCTLNANYIYDIKTIETMNRELTSKVDSIIRQTIREGMDDYEKEKSLHDYLVRNITYDHEGLRSGKAEIYEAHSALIHGKAVCSGISKAMKMLLDRVSIESTIATGELLSKNASGYENHAWNIVKIKGNFYHLDVTNDLGSKPLPRESVNYYYFNLDDKETSIDHKWNTSIIPECKSVQCNYYRYSGLLISDISILNIKIEAALYNRKDNISFKFSSEKNQCININSLQDMVSQAWRSISNARGTFRHEITGNDKLMTYNLRFTYQ